MTASRAVVLPLQILLVLTFALLLMVSTLSVPGGFSYRASHSADFAEIRWPLFIAVELILVCILIIVAATWVLLGRVARDQVFNVSSLRWVDLIIAALGVGWAIATTVLGFAVASEYDPGAAVAATLLILPGAVVVLLMFVMRSLLAQATAYRADLEGVI